MIVNISVIPGCLHKDIDRHRKITPIFEKALEKLKEQGNHPEMEIIVQLPNGEDIIRRIYPDPKFPKETPENYCLRVQKEIKKIV